MIGGQIKVVMTLDDKDFTVRTVKAGETIRSLKGQIEGTGKATRDMERNFTSMGTKFKDVVFAISIMRFAFKDLHDLVLALPIAFIKAGGEMERMMALMEGLSKETDALKKRAEALSNVQFVFNFAQNAPFELKTVTDLFVKLKTAGLDPTDGSMKALTNSLAKFGANDEQVKRAGIAIQQMAGKGVVSMEELRQQLGEAVPNAMEMMARGMGLTMAELANKVSKGTVEARTAISKMLIQMEIDALGASERLKATLPGAVAQLKTEWELFKIAASGEGAGDVVKEQIQELVAFMRGGEGKQFAKDVGSALKAAVEGVVAIKDALVAAWPIIKAVGLAIGALWAGNAVRAGVQSVRASIAETVASFQELRQKQMDVHREAISNIQAQVQQNRIKADAITKSVQAVIGEEKAAHLNRVKAAEAELEQVRKLAAAKTADANLATARAGVLYAEAVKFERAINEIDASGKSRQGVKRQNFVDNMNAYRQETVALQSKAVAMRNEAAASVEAAEKKLLKVQADKSALALTPMTLSSYERERQALVQQNVELQKSIDAENRKMNSTREAAKALMSFGSTILYSMGITAAFTAITMGLSWAYDRVTKSARDAAAAEKGLQDLRAGKNSQKAVDDSTIKLNQLNADIIAQESALADAEARALENSTAGLGATKRAAAIKASLADLRRERDEVQRLIDSSRRALNLSAAESDTYSIANQIRLLTDQELAKTESFKRLQQIDKKLKEESVLSNKKLYDGAIKENMAATQQYLADKKRLIGEAFAGRIAAAGSKELKDALLVEQQKQFADIEKQMADAKRDPRYVVPTTPGGPGAADKAESPLLKLIEKQKADFAKAKADLDLLGAEARDYVDNAQTKAAFDVLAKLASGDFDYGTKKNPGESPAQKERGGYIAELQKWLAEGKGSAVDFIDSLGTLDGKMENSTVTWKEAIKQYIAASGPLNETEQRNKALTAIFQKQADVSEELSQATEAYKSNVEGLWPGVAQLEREMARLAERSKLSGQALLEFQQSRDKMLADKMLAEMFRSITDGRRKLSDLQIAGIVNVAEREAAQHKANMDRLDAEFNKSLADIKALEVAETRKAELIEKLEADIALRRKLEQERARQALKSDLEKVADAWRDLGGNIDKAVASHADKWMDAIADFTLGAKVKWSDMVRAFLEDLYRVQLKKQLAGAVEGIFESIGNKFREIVGLGKAPNSKMAGGVPVTAAGNVPVEIVNGGTATNPSAPGDSNSPTTMWERAKSTLTDFWNSVKSGFGQLKGWMGGIWDSIKTGFGQVQDWMGSIWNSIKGVFSGGEGGGGLGGIWDSITSMFSGGGGDGGGFWSQAASWVGSFFANGGIMTSNGAMDLPVHAYKKGGIANKPQMAVFGEGDMNEAFVPLPDGRSIPVTMNMAAQSKQNVTQVAQSNVMVNVINQTSTPVNAQQGQTRFDGKQMIVDVVMSEAARPGPFRDALRNTIK